MPKIKLIPTLLAVIVQQLLGLLFYYPSVFGDLWRQSIGRTQELQPELSTFIVASISSLAIAIGLQWFFYRSQQPSWKNYFRGIFFIWLFFMIPSLALHYSFIGYSASVLLIDGTHMLLCIVMASMVVLTVPKKAVS